MDSSRLTFMLEPRNMNRGIELYPLVAMTVLPLRLETMHKEICKKKILTQSQCTHFVLSS